VKNQSADHGRRPGWLLDSLSTEIITEMGMCWPTMWLLVCRTSKVTRLN